MRRAQKARILNLEQMCRIALSNPVLISGGFDPIHPGHISYIQEASKLGNSLIVVVNGDSFLKLKKGKAFQTLDVRCEIVANIINVDYVVPYEAGKDMTVCGALEAIKPRIFANGGDRVSDNIPEHSVCENLGIEMVFGVGQEKVHSSSEILKRWESND